MDGFIWKLPDKNKKRVKFINESSYSNNGVKMLHEDRNKLSEKTKNMKRAIDSLREELEAIDWYNQRAEVCSDENLKKILIHNANEEKEHAAMLFEWIRQNDKDFDHEISDYLFAKTADITSVEEGHD